MREQRDSPSCVKVVCGGDGRALYFSRCAIPFCRDRDPDEMLAETPWLLHVVLYAYRRDFLLKLTQLPPSHLERLEKLEQLRALEAGAIIQVAIVQHSSVGIDTPEDYARFVKKLSVVSYQLSVTKEPPAAACVAGNRPPTAGTCR